jgi:predicted MFS family arabinose efflux permease
MGKLLFIVGLVIAGIGVAIMLGVPFGRLPGDIVVRRGAFTFYFPLATSVVLSVLLTFLLMLFRR